MASPNKNVVEYEIRRQQRKRRRHVVEILAAVVALAAALALMVPAISITADKATPEAGFFLDGAQVAQAPRLQVTTLAANESAQPVQVPARNANGTVQTIANPAGTTINLFDYWVDNNLKDTAERYAWPGGFNGSGWSQTETAQHSKAKLSGTGNNKGINQGHELKFSPAWGGTVENGTTGKETEDGNYSLNGWTGKGSNRNGKPSQGIVQDTLYGGYPMLTTNSSLGTDGESLAYLFNPEFAHNGKESYTNVNHLFYVDADGYYVFQSNDYDASFDKKSDGGNFTLRDHTQPSRPGRGFWPFGQEKYWVGMHMKTDFSMPAGGTVLNPAGQDMPMTFEFAGDDDAWVYIDGILIGDGGGIHNITRISIDFKTGVVIVNDDDNNREVSRTTLKALYEKNGIAENYTWNGDTFADGSYHTFNFFYLERGGGESNLYIKYNMVSTYDFTGHKAYENNPQGVLARDQFQFQLIGLDGQYGTDGSLKDGSRKAIMPSPKAEDASAPAGSVANPSLVDDRDGRRQVYTVGVSEDGNINFGTATISADEMSLADQGNPSVYRYIIKEVIPDDAVNALGITYAAATDEQKAAGGFMLGNVNYDGKIYYMTAQVTTWTDADNKKHYGLSKKYYKDPEYMQPADDKFVSFTNRYATPLTMKVDKTSDSDKKLEGVEFALYKAVYDETAKSWAAYTTEPFAKGKTNAQGTLEFPDLPAGNYLLKETEGLVNYKPAENDWLVSIGFASPDASAGGAAGSSAASLMPTIVSLNKDGSTVEGQEPQTASVVEGAFTCAVTNTKLPRGDISVVKKWYKSDGVTEYSAEEIEGLGDEASGAKVSGELWRKWTTEGASSETSGSEKEEQVDKFDLSKENGWKQTWNSGDLQERDYDYEYFLRNVSETGAAGFMLVDEPEVVANTETGALNYVVKNVKEGPTTDLVVRKVWGDGANHAGEVVRYKIQRSDYDAQGVLVTGPYDYVALGASKAQEQTLSSSDAYLGIAWQKHHEKLPANNGVDASDVDYREYRYSVVETSQHENYTVAYDDAVDVYEGEPYAVKVIRNMATDSRITVEKKWLNNARTAELTSGIPQGAYITGTLTKQYTYTEPSGVKVEVYFRSWVDSNNNEPQPVLKYSYAVESGTTMSLWALDANGNEPQGYSSGSKTYPAVELNGKALKSGGVEAKTFRINNSYDKSAPGYCFKVTGDSKVIIDWGYNSITGSGDFPGYYWDVSYAKAGQGDGQAHTTNPEKVGDFRLDAANGWQWSWTDRGLDTDHDYVYAITNVQEHKADGEVVAHYDGFAAPEAGGLTKGQDGKWTMSIVNVQDKVEIPVKIVKVEAGKNGSGDQGSQGSQGESPTSRPLANAKFTLTQVDENGNNVEGGFSAGPLSTDERGELLFPSIAPGRYKLEETEAPAGYILSEGPYFLEITADGADAVTVGSQMTKNLISYELQNGQHVYTVQNTPGESLPNTGGAGTRSITALGSVLIFGALVVLVRNRRSAMR